MITIILEDGEGMELNRISYAGNDRFLIRKDVDKYDVIHALNEYDYDVFSADDMNGLIGDLLKIRNKVGLTEIGHIDEVLALAEKCKANPRSTLTFTPFEYRPS
jgi:hypothetical protein